MAGMNGVTKTAASASAAGGSMVLVMWVLGKLHVDMPADVAVVAVGLLSPVVHGLAKKVNKWLDLDDGDQTDGTIGPVGTVIGTTPSTVVTAQGYPQATAPVSTTAAGPIPVSSVGTSS